MTGVELENGHIQEILLQRHRIRPTRGKRGPRAQLTAATERPRYLQLTAFISSSGAARVMSTPVHSHPLSPQEATSSRNTRVRLISTRDAEAAKPRPTTSYFALKSHSEELNPSTQPSEPPHSRRVTANWDGSVRGYGTRQENGIPKSSNASRPLPVFTLGPSQPTPPRTPPEVSGVDQDAVAQVLTTKWHLCSDEEIEAAVAQISSSGSSADPPPHPYHAIVRVLSSALVHAAKARSELEAEKRSLEAGLRLAEDKVAVLFRTMDATQAGTARDTIDTLKPDEYLQVEGLTVNTPLQSCV